MMRFAIFNSGRWAAGARRPLLIGAALMSLVHGAALFAAEPASGNGGEWKLVSESNGLAIFNRPRAGSAIKEVKAVGTIEAAPLVVKRVIEDAEEFPSFMPYVVESRVISRNGDTLIGYQRISPPIISDRDYTMRIRSETRRDAAGAVCYVNRWEAANDLGPPVKRGVARVGVNEGSWLLEPVAGGSRTRATYCVYTDSGGSVPATLANAANKTAIPKLFEAVRRQARLGKYSAEK